MNLLSMTRISLPALLSLASLALLATAKDVETSTCKVPGVMLGGEFGMDNYNYCQAAIPPTPSDYAKPCKTCSLAHLQIVVRHGDRTPIHILEDNEKVDWRCDDIIEKTRMDDKKDGEQIVDGYRPLASTPARKIFAHNTWERGTCMLGQLTRKGIDQHVTLGKRFREIYVDKLHYLKDNLTSVDLDDHGYNGGIYVRSSHHRRTGQSAASFLTGAWPEAAARAESADAIPVHYYPEDLETFFGHVNGNCPRLNQLMLEIRESKPFQEMMKSHSALRSRIDTVLKSKDVTKFKNTWVTLFDGLITRHCHQKDLPCNGKKCITERDVLELNQGVSEETALLRGATKVGDEYNRLTLGFFLGELTDRLLDGMRGRVTDPSVGKEVKKPARFEMFSGHDDTVYGLLAMLLSKDLRWPPYASNLIFELWRKDGSKPSKRAEDHLIRVLYNGKVIEADWCDLNACPLPKFLEQIKPFVVRDMKTACKAH